jgi:hypothetical protein
MVKDPAPSDLMRSMPPGEIAGEPTMYRHEPAGIWERSGYVPLWLKLVSFGLIVWGVYYAMRYWNSY